MKTIIISTKHNWVEKIHSGIKKDEVRKTAPEAPFKALIYDTKTSGGCGKVVSEFICNKVEKVEPCFEYYRDYYDIDDDTLAETCLTEMDLHIYGNGKPLRVLHISQLKIYDKPKELSEFKKPLSSIYCTGHKEYGCDKNCISFSDSDFYCKEQDIWSCGLKRPFQSWGYVEEI